MGLTSVPEILYIKHSKCVSLQAGAVVEQRASTAVTQATLTPPTRGPPLSDGRGPELEMEHPQLVHGACQEERRQRRGSLTPGHPRGLCWALQEGPK